MECPRCESTQTVKNGSNHNGKAKRKCKVCGRQFVANPQPRRISSETKALIEKLLLERLSLAAIVRITGVSKRWLQYYVNQRYAHQGQQATVQEKKRVV